MPTEKPTKLVGFTESEKAAMRERIKEEKLNASNEGALHAVRAKISEMPEPDRILAEGFHRIVTRIAPALLPKTWYGMPAYMNDQGKTVCFFQAASKFGARYATFGFNEAAQLDDGALWPTSFALTELSPQAEERIAALIGKAVGGA